MEHFTRAAAPVLDTCVPDERFHRQESLLALHAVAAQTHHAIVDRIPQLLHRLRIIPHCISECVLEVLACRGEIEERLFVPGWLRLQHDVLISAILPSPVASGKQTSGRAGLVGENRIGEPLSLEITRRPTGYLLLMKNALLSRAGRFQFQMLIYYQR
jgi:hypothetical protein